MGSTKINDKKKSLRPETNNPEFYLCYEFKCVLPGNLLNINVLLGSAFLRIEIWDDDNFGEDMIGYTEIDVEDRYFSP